MSDPIPTANEAVAPPEPTVARVAVDTRPGDVTLAWRSIVATAWLLAFFAYAAVWQASVQLGLATWWIGPRSTPTPALVRAIPFLVTIIGILMALYNVPRLPRRTMILAALSAMIAVPDFSRSVGLAGVELAISVSMFVVGAASLTGRYRAVASAAGAERTDDDVEAGRRRDHGSADRAGNTPPLPAPPPLPTPPSPPTPPAPPGPPASHR